MRTGPEGQARVQIQHHAGVRRHLVTAGTDPQAPAEAHRPEVRHPRLVGQPLGAHRDSLTQRLPDGVGQTTGVAVGVEQGLDLDALPERRGAGVRLENRLIGGITQGDGLRPQGLQQGLGRFAAGRRQDDRDLQPTAGGHFSSFFSR